MSEIEIVPDRKFGIPIEIGSIFKGKDPQGTEAVFIEGYASTRDLDRSGEVVEPTAFEKWLPKYMKNPVITYMHDWSQPIGRTVQARIDTTGLWVRAFVSNAATTVIELIKQGILKGFSIGYNVVKAEERDGVDHLTEVELYEIAVVTIPANRETLFTLAKALREGATVGQVKALFAQELRKAEEEKYIEIVPTIIEVI
ncbi:MAG: HK97 family phage prohead protease [Candidatus Abyssobacteria bacterium SURF_17]|uniref:HK97 family phage prohead protease n=1 Tax=Candidatus Abyssobacteria bacterium SURF_17 TaxID=2093361 RepID=A0A419EWW6_9BACT|nr:MAG: HK97 family phage prohead protease [Candidatus Abyssubacteria bacterium SURF_17]